MPLDAREKALELARVRVACARGAPLASRLTGVWKGGRSGAEACGAGAIPPTSRLRPGSRISITRPCWQVVENLRDLVGDAPRVERGALLHNAGLSEYRQRKEKT
jgi:hypothetical protein